MKNMIKIVSYGIFATVCENGSYREVDITLNLSEDKELINTLDKWLNKIEKEMNKMR